MFRVTQPIPQLTERDVERIASQDFGSDAATLVLGELSRYGTEAWHVEPIRVRVAILKMAAGTLEKLSLYVDSACADPRNVLVSAEYPRFFAASLKESLNWWKRSRLFAQDWKEYKLWLAE